MKTQRLILRPWKEEDLEPFAAMNADFRVMEFFPSVLTREESDALAKKIQGKIEKNGWGLWAISFPPVADFIGFIGLNLCDKETFPSHFTPAVEIGWRLAFEYWGKGLATEGALASLAFGFETLKLEEIVSFTIPNNMRSRKVMEKIGMHRDLDGDFDHPRIPKGNPFQRHVLYRIKREEWIQ